MSASLVCSVLAAFASSQSQMDVGRTDTDYTFVSFVQLHGSTFQCASPPLNLLLQNGNTRGSDVPYFQAEDI